MAAITAMNIIPAPAAGVSLYNVNGHKAPAINGLAYVLNADVAAAQAFGWTVANPQPSILSGNFVHMNPPAGGLSGGLAMTLPDGTTLSSLVAPNQCIRDGSSRAGAASPFSGQYQLDKDVMFNIPVQWVEYMWLANGWRNWTPV